MNTKPSAEPFFSAVDPPGPMAFPTLATGAIGFPLRKKGSQIKRGPPDSFRNPSTIPGREKFREVEPPGMAHQASPSSALAPCTKDIWVEREGPPNAILGTFAPEWVRSRDFFQPRLHGTRKFDALPDGQRSSDLASPCSLSLKPQTRLPNATDNLPIKMTLLINRECYSKADPSGLRNTATRGSPSSGSPPGTTSSPAPIFSHARKRHLMTYARRKRRKKPEGNPGSSSYAHHFQSSLQGYPSGRPRDVFHHAN